MTGLKIGFYSDDPAVTDTNPVTKTTSDKKLSEQELLAIIANNTTKEKGYVQAIALITLFNLCVSIAMVLAVAMQNMK